MNNSVRNYMIKDLVTLTLLGVFLEAILTKFVGFVLDAAPTIIFSLLITYVAVARWNLWGLLVSPFLAFATMLGGSFSDMSYYAAFYKLSNWQLFLSIELGLCGLGINVLFFRKHRTNKIMSNTGLMLLILLLDYAVYCGLQLFFYRLFTFGTLATDKAVIAFTYTVKTEMGTQEMVKNLANYSTMGFIYNSLGLIIAIIGLLVLRSQGALNNAVDKLLSDKKEREEELEFLRTVGNVNWEKLDSNAPSEDESKK